MKQHSKRVFLICLALLLFASGAQAEAKLSFLKEERFASQVVKPFLVGMDNAFVQDGINAAIEERGGFQAYLATLRALSDAGQSGLTVLSEGSILPIENSAGLLRLRVEASGRIGPGRPGHKLTPLMYDLSDGRAITAEELFIDPDEAAAQISQLVEEHVLPELSNYLDPSGFEPIPMDAVLIEENGLSFFYGPEQLVLLSGKPASLHFHYQELQDLLNLDEGSLLQQLGVPRMLQAEPANRELIAAIAAEGRLPGIPFKLGDSMVEIRENQPLLIDPEAFPGGSKYELEDARLRGSLLITQGVSEAVQGILSQRMLMHGLITGVSTREQAIGLLGEPKSSLSLDQAAAEGYGLKEGKLDSYQYGANELSLNYDEQDLLQAVWLRPAQQ